MIVIYFLFDALVGHITYIFCLVFSFRWTIPLYGVCDSFVGYSNDDVVYIIVIELY